MSQTTRALFGRGAATSGILAIALFVLVACGGDDRDSIAALSTQVAALQTAAARPTDNPASVLPTGTPIAGAAFCSAVGKWGSIHARALSLYGTASRTQEDADWGVVRSTFAQAWEQTIPIPPAGNTEAVQLRELILNTNVVDDRLLSLAAIWVAITGPKSDASLEQRIDVFSRLEAVRIERDAMGRSLKAAANSACP